ncbi:MAG TPA: hypothetical protein PLB02_08580 [Thermoanaerobaculia bacterium]|nr:hypothetical protein [Thermoanaerobaculia bacterium]
MDHGRIPAWRRGIDLAHTVCAAVAGGALARTDAGRRLRSAAVSVPSLVGEAFLDLTASSAGEALSRASVKLSEVAQLLAQDPVRQSLGEAETASLLAEIEALREDLDGLSANRRTPPGH